MVLRHVVNTSLQGSPVLIDREWNESHYTQDVLDVETAYQSSVTWMAAQGYDATDDPTPLPEESLTDYPPSD